MNDRVICYYSIQLSFLHKNVYYVCVIQKQHITVFRLFKFYVFRMMQLHCSRKLDMCQVTRAMLMLKFHTFPILFIIPRETSYSSSNICHTWIFKNCLCVNIQLEIQKSLPLPQKFQKICKISEGRAGDAKQTFFQLPPQLEQQVYNLKFAIKFIIKFT